jgi:hypothetical protein
MELSFDRKSQLITIQSNDIVDLHIFYRRICDWLARPDNMSLSDIARGEGFIPVAGGLRTVPVITLLNWRISANEPLIISGGYLGAVDENHEAVSPVDPNSFHLIKLEH